MENLNEKINSAIKLIEVRLQSMSYFLIESKQLNEDDIEESLKMIGNLYLLRLLLINKDFKNPKDIKSKLEYVSEIISFLKSF